jgi:tetratricopeptide (TPR) repeat protein
VRRLGETITINAQLISTETGAHVWADRFEGERGKLGELQVEFVSRLANSLGVELVKAEAMRAARERSENPDANDLAIRGWPTFYLNPAYSTDAIALFERALTLDMQNVRALTGLTFALVWRAFDLTNQNPASDVARAQKAIDDALAIQPDSSLAHGLKSWMWFLKQQWGETSAEAKVAIDYDRNNAMAHAVAGFFNLFAGRAEDAVAGLETALRLSPRDPFAPHWHYYLCHVHTHLAHWEEAINWCNKSVAGNPRIFYPLIDLAAANAWAGHDKEVATRRRTKSGLQTIESRSG